MGALSPLFLLAGAAVAIPLYLHLFHRHQTRRLSFPALRYLERTEREHARQIRLRQILLMLARIAVLLLVVGAGARLFFSGRGASHPPTAVVLILDNSMSSGLVVGEVRVLDELKALADRTLEAATSEDRFWVIRAGEPWLPAIPGSASEAQEAVRSTEVSDAAGDLSSALQRAVRLLETATLPNREIHLVSDLQAAGFGLLDVGPAGDVPVVVWRGDVAEAPNRALTGVVIGGGLPPLEGQRTEVTISALEAQSDDDTTHVPLRLVVNERIRGAATLPPGSQTTVSLPASGTGWIQGYADADPDDLRADDRRFFSYRSRPAPAVSGAGDAGLFLGEALAVLEDAGRTRRAAPAEADMLFSSEGEGLDSRGDRTATLVVPPSDPTRLPALNRRLEAAGIPWRISASSTLGEADLTGPGLPDALAGVRVRARYALDLEDDPPGPTRTIGEVDGAPWAVEGTDAGGRRYLLIGSALDAGGTSLPVSTGLLRFVEWAASEWSGSAGARPELEAGSHLSAPVAATHVRFPGGAEFEIDGTRMVRGTGEAGIYTFLAADTVVSVAALNTPVSESRLAMLPEADVIGAIGRDVTEVSRAAAWDGAVFRARQGPELWWPFLLAVLVLLGLEALMATSGERNPLSLRHPSEIPAADGVD